MENTYTVWNCYLLKKHVHSKKMCLGRDPLQDFVSTCNF